MKEILNELKIQLFDAPSEVKEAFNRVVSYFDFGKGKYSEPYWYICAEVKGNSSGKGSHGSWQDWKDTFRYAKTAKEAEDSYKSSLEENGYKVLRIKAFPCKMVTGGKGKSYPSYNFEDVKRWENSSK